MTENSTTDNERKTKENIDYELDKWYRTVEETMKRAIPTMDIQIMPHPRITQRTEGTTI